MTRSELIHEFMSRQLPDIPKNKLLQYQDFKRITKYIDKSIFNIDTCCIWKGYVTNLKTSKGIYINFFYRNKKIALHRLLYINFIGSLKKDEYIKFTCHNKGHCCSIYHMQKRQFKIDPNNEINTEPIPDPLPPPIMENEDFFKLSFA